MLDDVQFITEDGQTRFAVIAYQEYEYIKALLSDPQKLEDYLDYLHLQAVKNESPARHSLSAVKAELAIE